MLWWQSEPDVNVGVYVCVFVCLSVYTGCLATSCCVALCWLTAPDPLYNRWSLLCVWLYKHRVRWLPHAELQYWSLWRSRSHTHCPLTLSLLPINGSLCWFLSIDKSLFSIAFVKLSVKRMVLPYLILIHSWVSHSKRKEYNQTINSNNCLIMTITTH